MLDQCLTTVHTNVPIVGFISVPILVHITSSVYSLNIEIFMWTRKLSVSMDQDDFLKAFVRALSDETVIRKMQHAVCGQLHKEVSELRDIIKSRDDRIAELEKKSRPAGEKTR